MEVTRRSLVLGGLGGGAIIGLNLFAAESASAAAPGPGGIVAAPIGRSAIQFFSGDFTLAHELDIARIVRLASTRDVSGLLTLTFDNRLLDPADQATIEVGSNTRVVPADTTVSGFRTIMKLLLENVGQEVDFALPVRAKELYPADGIDGPLPMTLNLSPFGGAKGTAYRWATKLRSFPVSAWGAQVAIGWTPIAVSDRKSGREYRVPSVISVSSVGPAPVPAASLLEVDLDANVVADIALTSARLDSAEMGVTVVGVTRGAGLLRTTLQVDGVIPVGSRLDVRLTPTILVDATTTVARFGSVRLLAPGEDRARRATGLYQSSDLTTSGSPAHPNTALGRS